MVLVLMEEAISFSGKRDRAHNLLKVWTCREMELSQNRWMVGKRWLYCLVYMLA
jgi:hypothetical protein